MVKKEDEYYLYFDDSGIRFPDKQQMVRSDGMDHFALGGILLKKSDRGPVIEKYQIFCKKWKITYPLRSSDMRGKRGNYAWLKEQVVHDDFFKDLNEFLCSIPVVGFAAVVDRKGYNKRYEEKYKEKRWWMCKTAFNILIERVVKYVISKESQLRIRFEEGGKKEDRAILEYLKDLKRTGMPFDVTSSSKYSSLKSEDFQKIILGEPRRQEKKSPLLQIADLYLYPMVKGGYDKKYPPYRKLFDEKKFIDCFLSDESILFCGIKYSCFENI